MCAIKFEPAREPEMAKSEVDQLLGSRDISYISVLPILHPNFTREQTLRGLYPIVENIVENARSVYLVHWASCTARKGFHWEHIRDILEYRACCNMDIAVFTFIIKTKNSSGLSKMNVYW